MKAPLPNPNCAFTLLGAIYRVFIIQDSSNHMLLSLEIAVGARFGLGKCAFCSVSPTIRPTLEDSLTWNC